MTKLPKPKKQKKFNKNIGIFGSSFDPPHCGHLSVIKHLLTKGRFDELWLIPTYKHPFGKTLSPFKARVQMLSCLLGHLCPLRPYKILQIEKTIPQRPTYTWHVIRALKKKYPNHNFTLIVGTDVKKELRRWFKIKDLRKIVSFYFVPRKGYIKSPFPRVSSSDIREKVCNGKSIRGLTTRGVEKIILKNKLYNLEMPQIKNIYLTGFMGAGKTRIGRMLAQKFQRRFVDTDQLIEQHEGRSISTIFEKEGEVAFRKLETETIAKLGQHTNLVVALGGGAVLDPKNREILTQGFWIFINPSFEILKERILRREHRPLAKDVDTLTQLYNTRLPLYQLAPIQISVDGDPEDVCQEVVKKIMVALRNA